MPKVLIVEDDEVIAQGMARHLGAAGFDPVSVGNGTQGLARLRREDLGGLKSQLLRQRTGRAVRALLEGWPRRAG